MNDPDVLARLKSLEGRMEKLEMRLSGDTAPTDARTKKMSAKEFLLTKGPRTETQKVLALAYFIERNEGAVSFNVQDLEAVFHSAREKLPANMNDAVNKNIARGFLMPAKEKKDSRKAWQLTATGERFVETDMK